MNLEPVFDFITGEPSVMLQQGRGEVCIDGNTYVGEGEVRLDLLPRAHIHIYGYFHDVTPQDGFGESTGQKAISYFSFNGHQIEGFKLSSRWDLATQEYNLKWCANSEPVNGVGDKSTQMTSVVFHLFNFVDLIGTRRSTKQNGATMHRIEHIDLTCDEWKVELKSLISTQENIKALKEEGGYRLTHVGGIQKDDGTLFTGKDANECLYALRFFLSFAKGIWCEPACAVGFNNSGDRVWETWSSPREP